MKSKWIGAANSKQLRVGPQAAKSVRELLSYSDRDFITCAYLTLLHRPPDLSGMNYYLGRLRRGYSRAGVIVQLLKSEEARRSTISLPGLKELQQRHRWTEYALGKATTWVARQLRYLARGVRLPNKRMAAAGPKPRKLSTDLPPSHTDPELPDLSGLSLVAQKILIDLHEAAWGADNKRGS